MWYHWSVTTTSQSDMIALIFKIKKSVMWLVDKPWANQIAWKCFKFMLPWVKATHRCRCWAPKCCDVAVAAGNNGEFADVAHEDAGNYCRAPCDGIRRTPRWLVIQLVQKIYTAVLHWCTFALNFCRKFEMVAGWVQCALYLKYSTVLHPLGRLYSNGTFWM